VIASCKKDHDEDEVPAGEDYGCIERIILKTNDHSINSTDVLIVNNLFSKANIDFSQFRYYQYKHDSSNYYYAPYNIRDRKMVWVERGDRGLPVFKAERIYLFWNDTLEPNPYDVDVSRMVSVMDTFPNSSLARVRRLFRHDLEKYYPTDNNSQRIDYSDTCFIAEFGFYKRIVDKHNTHKFNKAWRVFKKNSPADLPAGYYDDETGKKLSFYLSL
jgi:hypothetical protein